MPRVTRPVWHPLQTLRARLEPCERLLSSNKPARTGRARRAHMPKSEKPLTTHLSSRMSRIPPPRTCLATHNPKVTLEWGFTKRLHSHRKCREAQTPSAACPRSSPLRTRRRHHRRRRRRCRCCCRARPPSASAAESVAKVQRPNHSVESIIRLKIPEEVPLVRVAPCEGGSSGFGVYGQPPLCTLQHAQRGNTRTHSC